MRLIRAGSIGLLLLLDWACVATSPRLETMAIQPESWTENDSKTQVPEAEASRERIAVARRMPGPMTEMNESTAPRRASRLSPEDEVRLAELGWRERVGSELGVWVSVARQMLYLIQDGVVVWRAPCATSTAGVGSLSGSYQTPAGWHRVAQKFGGNAQWGQVFRARRATAEVWHPGDDTRQDLVLTRILWLEGLEPGRNEGVNAAGVSVDSKERYIYIHGTNDERQIGTPSSRGCIRLRNDDVITAYDRILVGTPILVSE